MVAIPVSGRLQRAGRRTRRRAFGLRPVPSSLSRPFGVNPSRLRACGAARFACLQGIGARPIPAARCLAPLGENRTGSRWIGQASAPPLGQDLADTPGLAVAGCINTCRPRRWRFVVWSSRRTVLADSRIWPPGLALEFLTTPQAWPPHGAGCVAASRWGLALPESEGVPLESLCGDAELAMPPFGAGSAHGVLVLL
jgi:hypothetical protein